MFGGNPHTRWAREAGVTLYNQPGTVAVLFDPEGGTHPCNELQRVEHDVFWAAGMCGKSPEELAARIQANWFRVDRDPETDYARRERCFGEQP